VPKDHATSIEWVADRASAYGMPGIKVAQNDAVAVYEAVAPAIERARRGEGPSLIEVKTDRYFGHFQGDAEVYRPKDEVAQLRKNDPIPKLAARLKSADLMSEADEAAMVARAKQRVAAAFAYARESAYPAPQEAFAPRLCLNGEKEEHPMTARKLTMAQAIAEAIGQEMERDSTVFAMGEDIGKYGGIFGATGGLLDKFGPERIMDTPISETAFIGAATGAAAAGMRPIAELMFVDFFGVCMDQIYNHLAKNTYMAGGNIKLPVVITTAIGGGYSDAAQHSQCLYATFAHVPGLKVVVPSNAYDAKGLMIQSIRDDNPVMFMYHKGIMGLPWMAYYEGSSNEVPEEPYTIPFGEAKVVRAGEDVTIVTLSQMVQKSLLAAEELARQGISAEVLDLRTLVPLDRAAVLKSVAKTGRLLVADEDYLGFGLTGEIAAIVAENLDTVVLKAPVRRLAVPNVPIPYSRPLEQFVIPQVQNIVEAAQSLMKSRIAEGTTL